jgi:hypothetical protein
LRHKARREGKRVLDNERRLQAEKFKCKDARLKAASTKPGPRVRRGYAERASDAGKERALRLRGADRLGRALEEVKRAGETPALRKTGWALGAGRVRRCEALRQRAQHAVPLRLGGASDLKDRAEETSGRRAAKSNSGRSKQRPYGILLRQGALRIRKREQAPAMRGVASAGTACCAPTVGWRE